jgi:hypothetical protein
MPIQHTYFRRLFAWWHDLLKWERWLIIGISIYLALLLVYIFLWTVVFVKIPMLVLGIALIALVPELTTERRVRLMIVLILALAIGTAFLQIHDEDSSEKDHSDLVHRIVKLQTKKDLDDTLIEKERHFKRESVIPDPIDFAKKFSSPVAAQGFLDKASRLLLRSELAESRLAVEFPSLAERVLAMSTDPVKKRAAYVALRDSPGFTGIRDDRAMPLINGYTAHFARRCDGISQFS